MVMSRDNLFAIRNAERDTLLDRIIMLLKADRRVAAAWLIGSLGNGSADSLSDIDVWVVVSDADMDEVIAARQDFVARISDLLLLQEAPQNAPSGGAYLQALYSGKEGPQQVDWYWERESNAKRPLDALLLFDHVDIPQAEANRGQSEYERFERAIKQTAFFWLMCLTAAKRIARHQRWGALTVIGLLSYTVEEIEWLVGLREDQPGYKDTRTNLPPVQPEDQLATLRLMAVKVERITSNIKEIRHTNQTKIVLQVRDFFDLIEEEIQNNWGE